jgi:TRAP transporter TAXI family solute receptor
MIRILAIACAALCALSAPAPAQQVVAIGVTQAGSLLYAGGAGIVKVMEKLNLQGRLQPFAGSSTYAPMLDRNELDFGLINVDDAMTAYRGIDNFDGKPNQHLRIVCVLFPLPFGALVPADSPAKTIRDLKGVKMPSQFVGMSTARKLQDAVLATADLSTADMQGVPVANLFHGIDAMAAGRVDAAAIGPGTAQVQIAHTTLASRGGVRYLSIDDTPEAAAKLRKVVAGRIITVQPAKHMPGIVGPTNVMAYSMFFMTNDKASPEMIYKLAKEMHDSKAVMAEAHPVMAGFNPDRMTENSDTPFHDGAIKFYREIGQWPPKD